MSGATRLLHYVLLGDSIDPAEVFTCVRVIDADHSLFSPRQPLFPTLPSLWAAVRRGGTSCVTEGCWLRWRFVC
jgi:hypothetical protein